MNENYFDKHGLVHATNGSLPHWHQTGKLTFVTFRLHDSVPKNVIDHILSEYEQRLVLNEGGYDKKTLETWKWEKYNRIEKYLDKGSGECLLKNPECRNIVSDALLHFDNIRYNLLSYVIMPNHVHTVLVPQEEWMVQDIIKSIKHYSALQINKLLGRSGKVWQTEGFDRIILDEEHYLNILRYINNNPRNLPKEFFSLYFAPKLF